MMYFLNKGLVKSIQSSDLGCALWLCSKSANAAMPSILV